MGHAVAAAACLACLAVNMAQWWPLLLLDGYSVRRTAPHPLLTSHGHIDQRVGGDTTMVQVLMVFSGGNNSAHGGPANDQVAVSLLVIS